MFEELKQMNAELEELKAKHLERSKEMFTKVAALLFEKHPKLKSFGWNQYTPYFNDGEECVFSANTDYLKINDSDEDSGEGVDYFNTMKITNYGTWDSVKRESVGRVEVPNPDYDIDMVKARDDAKEFLSNVDDSVLRDLFGDHVEITVTAKGTSVDEYEHD